MPERSARPSTDLFVRLNEKESTALDNLRRRHGLSRSELVRRLIFAAHDGSFVPPMSTFEQWHRER